MPSVKGDAPATFWYDPVAYLTNAPGVAPDVVTFWTNAVGSTLGQSFYITSDFALSGHPSYVAMTAENIALVGLSVMFNQWMLEYVWTLYCND